MEQSAEQFKLETLERKKIEKLCRQEKDARIHKRLSALLWLNKGYATQEVADLLQVSAHHQELGRPVPAPRPGGPVLS